MKSGLTGLKKRAAEKRFFALACFPILFHESVPIGVRLAFFHLAMALCFLLVEGNKEAMKWVQKRHLMKFISKCEAELSDNFYAQNVNSYI